MLSGLAVSCLEIIDRKTVFCQGKREKWRNLVAFLQSPAYSVLGYS